MLLLLFPCRANLKFHYPTAMKLQLASSDKKTQFQCFESLKRNDERKQRKVPRLITTAYRAARAKDRCKRIDT